MRTRLVLSVAVISVAAGTAAAWAQRPPVARPTASPAVTAPVSLPAPQVPPVPAAPDVPVAPPAPQTPQAKVPMPAPPAPPQAPKAPAAPRAPDLYGANVRVDVTLTDQGSAGTPIRKSISLTVAEHSRGSVRSGVTIPVPTTTFTPASEEGGGKPQPMTSYQYRDVGLSLDVQDVAVSGSLIRLRVAVEYNPVDEKTANQEGLVPAPRSGPPAFARFTQSLTLVLEDGKPLTVAQSSDPVPGRTSTASLEVKATIVKAGTGK